MKSLLLKEIKDIFKDKTALIYFILLFGIISYSFYSGVDLYSKASEGTVNNPLYAAGFEPVPGVFVPTFGGFFIVISLIAPFLIIQSISNEKKYNTLCLLAQFPYSMGYIFTAKLFAAVILVLVSIALFAPTFVLWNFLGGHIPFREIILLLSGYFFYGLFVISVSFFSASLFSASAPASIFTLAFIMLSWFLDFGREMNINPFFNMLSEWTVTIRLKDFENGILSIQSIIYFILLASFFSLLSFYFFNLNLKNKFKPAAVTVLIYLILFILAGNAQYKLDISESRKNSFSVSETEFLNKLPAIDIDIFLKPTDSRYKDYENDFLKKLRMVKNDLKIRHAEGKSLNDNYGRFRYSIDKKSATTLSNSENEIFMIFEDISGLKIESSIAGSHFTGYPLIVKDQWSVYLFILYLVIFPLILFFIHFKKPNIHGARREQT